MVESCDNQFDLGNIDSKTCQCLVQAIQKLASARTMADVADVVRVAARNLVNADGATFVLLEGSDTVYYVEEDAIGPLWKGQRFQSSTCISGIAIATKTQVVIEDIFADDRVPHEYYSQTFVKSMVMTPVRKNDPIAAIGTYWQSYYKTSEQERALLQILADSASRAIEMIALLENLENKVQERTSELQEARDKAIELSKIKSTFISNISHDLRTPLSGLVSVAELLSDTTLDEEQRSLMEILQSSASSLLSLLNDVLDLTKIEAGRIDLENIPVNLMYIVQDATRAMSVTAFAKGLSLKVSLDYGLPELVLSDSLRLRQILANLIGNAIKFTESGAVIVSAEIVDETETHAAVRFAVKDSGIGMTADQIGNLFVPFVQSDRSISRRYGGTGLGLVITRQLVELMGGTIGVTSTPDEGTIFDVNMTFQKVGPVQLAEAITAEKGASHSIEGVNILLAEDNVSMQQLTTTQLERLGAHVMLVNNGAEALEALEKKTFDVVILDCNMPVMDGFEACRSIRASERSTDRHIPIVALTAAAMKTDVEKCFEVGMDQHIAKPVSMAKLQNIIAMLVQARKQKTV
jgi:signal transduction histidine kinase/ActR/RegA family two-component response regulator